jgi:glycosyltransferase involved in cell wall biosynthesis
MKVSLVIPVYNEEKYIKKCLNSVEKQIEKPDETIIVDNNSTDNTVNIVKKYNVRLLKEHKQGITPTRNKGFDNARFDIIARCDADSVLPPDWIKKIKKSFLERDIDAITGPGEVYDLIPRKHLSYKPYFDFVKFIQKGKETLWGPNMALKKSMWNKVKNETCKDDNKVHEDIDLALHILKNKGKIYRDNTLVVKMSARRLKYKTFSLLIEYPYRMIKTYKLHSFKI